MRSVRGMASVALPVLLSLVGGLCVATAVPSRGRPAASLHTQPLVKHRAETARLMTEPQCAATPDIGIPCYDPGQIQAAYDEGPLFARGVTGAGQTIAVVDSFGSPTIRRDLATFDAQFGLPAPPSLTVIQPGGRVPAFDSRTQTMVGWAGETTLDVEWAHAMAPGASILVVETPVSETEGTVGFPQIVAAERYVVDHHLATVISQSFGANEATFASVQAIENLRSAFVDAARQGVTVLAASGDTGASDAMTPTGATYSPTPTVTWPASDPLVTAVGGTQLTLDPAGRRTAPDRAWNDTFSPVVNRYVFGTSSPHPDASGGGLSSVFARPSYQDSVASTVGGRRGVPDISMSAACSGLVDTYQSFGGPTPPGWYYVCGTSEATPLFAGVVALADQDAGHGLGLINPALYAMASADAPGIVDVTQGNNSVSFSARGGTRTVQGYAAGVGYDLVTGLGTVDASLFVPELVHAVARVGTSATDATLPGAGPQGP